MSQNEYIALLFNDCGFTLLQSRAWLNAEYGSPYADRLPTAEKHRLIERLKALKQACHEAAARGVARDEDSGELFEES